jgi:hypothetical protein
MSPFVALALAVTLPLALTGCSQEGSGEANGSVRLEVIGGQPNEQLRVDWEPEPEYFGTVVNRTETVTEYGSVPVGTYTLTASRSGKTATTEVEVTEGETSEASVTLQ